MKPFARFLEYYMYRVRYPPITPNKLAGELGITPQTVLNWAKGTSVPKNEMLELLARKTGIPFSLLYRVAGHTVPPTSTTGQLPMEVILDLERRAEQFLAEKDQAEGVAHPTKRPTGIAEERAAYAADAAPQPPHELDAHERLEWMLNLPEDELHAIFRRMDAFIERAHRARGSGEPPVTIQDVGRTIGRDAGEAEGAEDARDTEGTQAEAPSSPKALAGFR